MADVLFPENAEMPKLDIRDGMIQGTGRAGQYYNIIMYRDIKCHNNQYRREIFSIIISAAQYYR